jgi:(p)ppGpp synthase/HD superfamily hydrolase
MKHVSLPALENISKALLMASVHHSKQVRKYDGAPYINHLIDVMHLLTNIGRITCTDVLCAAILHDTLEDTNLMPEQIEDELNADVLFLVNKLTDDKRQSLEKRRQVALEKLTYANREIKCIKLADICSNVAHIPKDWQDERVMDYIAWLDEGALRCRDANLYLFNEYLARRQATLKARF